MKTFLVPAALALALTASGGAFAANTSDDIDMSLYEEAPFFTEIKPPAFTTTEYWRSADRKTQRASTAPVVDSHGKAMQAQQGGADTFDPYNQD